jgi:hypothetical protein
MRAEYGGRPRDANFNVRTTTTRPAHKGGVGLSCDEMHGSPLIDRSFLVLVDVDGGEYKGLSGKIIAVRIEREIQARWLRNEGESSFLYS